MFACFSVTLSHGMGIMSKVASGVGSGLYSWVAQPAIHYVGGYLVDKATERFITGSLGGVRSISGTAYDALIAKCQERSNASSQRLDGHVRELLQAFYLVDDEGNVSSMVKEVVLSSVMGGGCPCCNWWCMCRGCCRATPTFFKIGSVIVEKSVIEYIRQSLERLQTYTPTAKAATCFLGQCTPDAVPAAPKKDEGWSIFRAFNLMGDNGKVPTVVQAVVNGITPDEPVKKGGVGGGKPSEQKTKFLSVKEAVRLGKIERVDFIDEDTIQDAQELARNYEGEKEEKELAPVEDNSGSSASSSDRGESAAGRTEEQALEGVLQADASEHSSERETQEVLADAAEQATQPSGETAQASGETVHEG